jgi:copper chaperone
MTRYFIPDMTCGHCKATVERTVKALDASASLSFDMAAQQVQIDTAADKAALLAALAAEGYPATPL